MTLYYDAASHAWAIDAEDPAPDRSWLPAVAGFIVLVGSIAAAGALQLLGA